MSKGWQGGSAAGWRKLRAEVLADNRRPPPFGRSGRCGLAIVDVCTRTATQVHHTLGRGITEDDRRYLMAVCAPCNQKVGDPTRTPDPPVRPVTSW